MRGGRGGRYSNVYILAPFPLFNGTKESRLLPFSLHWKTPSQGLLFYDLYDGHVQTKGERLLRSFKEGNVVAVPNTFFCAARRCANRNRHKMGLDCILTKRAGLRLARCINVRMPFLESPEPDFNLLYATPASREGLS